MTDDVPSSDDDLRCTIVDGIATVTIDRPRVKNAVPGEMWPVLRDLFLGFGTNPDVRTVVLTGGGADFGSGADVASLTAGVADLHPTIALRLMGEAVTALYQLAKPTVAKIRGVCAGVSLNLALACDLVVADDSARLTEIFARRGLSVDGGGAWMLPRLVGMQKAKELVFLADTIDAHEALRIGLITRVVPADQLDTEVGNLAARLAAGPTLALGLSKKLFEQASSLTLAQTVEAEGQTQTINFHSADFREAIRAFKDRRPPIFNGR